MCLWVFKRKIKTSQRCWRRVIESETCSPSGHNKTQLAHAVQQSWGLLEESRHLGVLVYRTLDWQETPVQFVDQTHVYYIAVRNTQEEKNRQRVIAFFFKCYNKFTKGDSLCKKLISHSQTKAFTVHTSTALQLKADTSPKPSTPAITVISPICLCQWQVSWSCSLYSFSHKSLLIVSLEGCCASPALDPWQSADPGRLLKAPVCLDLWAQLRNQ